MEFFFVKLVNNVNTFRNFSLDKPQKLMVTKWGHGCLKTCRYVMYLLKMPPFDMQD